MKRDALDQLRYEDIVLRHLLDAMADASCDDPTHGRMVKLFVERLAVREAARELVGEALAQLPNSPRSGSDSRLVSRQIALSSSVWMT